MAETAGSASILVVNTGSSSLKLGLYTHADGDERLQVDGLADGVGQADGTLTLRDASGKVLRSGKVPLRTQRDALREASQWMQAVSSEPPVAVGHRVVHGGPKLTEHQRITPEVQEELKACVHFAPLHIPMALELIEETERAYPGAPQFACFDTAFHRTLPQAASRFALPGELFEAGVRRYGFHGLSYESLVHQLGREMPSRVILAHLGSGASLAAVKDGKSVDTTMGLTPTGGIPMGTRSGDLDPGVLLYLLRTRQMSADSLETMLNHDAGLRALSGGTSDKRQLLESAGKGDARAALAVEVFCGRIAETVAAYATVLDGLDLLVFAGGIGEHSVEVRQRVCRRLGFFGVELDDASNRQNGMEISTQTSRVRVRMMHSEEDLQIARHCRDLLQAG